MKYRNRLPQLNGKLCLTDGGLETDLIFNHGIDLPAFSAISMYLREDGPAILDKYLEPYAQLAKAHDFGLILVAHTWRASLDWGKELGLNTSQLVELNAKSIWHLQQFREQHETPGTPMPIAGCLGPRGDGYNPGEKMSVAEATEYHDLQTRLFEKCEVDFVTAMTINYLEEAIGMAKACRDHGLPLELSFTVETDGHLPGGMPLKEAIEKCDEATNGYPAYYMINCAHPTHFRHVLEGGGEWTRRIRGVRANASCKSHAELDCCTELDDGNPEEFGQQMNELRELLPNIAVLGGCCGTDLRHITHLAEALNLMPAQA